MKTGFKMEGTRDEGNLIANALQFRVTHLRRAASDAPAREREEMTRELASLKKLLAEI